MSDKNLFDSLLNNPEKSKNTSRPKSFFASELFETTKNSNSEIHTEINTAKPSYVPRFTFRVNPMLIQKLRYIAKKSGHSVSKEVEQLIKVHVAEYEKKYGIINVKES